MKRRLKKTLNVLMCVFSLLMCLEFIPMKAAVYDYVPMTGKCLQQEAKEHLRLLNIERQKLGVPQLTMDADLMNAAETRAAEIAVYFSHTRPDGRSYATIHSKAIGENVCYGASTAEGSYKMFYNSPPHKQNMLQGYYTIAGIGAFQDETGRVHWVQLFGNSPVKTQTTYKKEVKKSVSVKTLGGKISYKLESLDNIINFYGGEKEEYTITGYHKDMADYRINLSKAGFKWSSSNSKVAKVTSKGVVYGLKKGTATITAKGLGVTLKKKVTVNGDNHITFKLDGGTLHNLQAHDVFYKIKLRKPTKEGSLFKGWYYDSGFTERAYHDDYIFEDETVYAKWWKVKVGKSTKPSLKITKSSKRLCVKIPEVDKADGYQIYYATNKDFKNTKKVLSDDRSYTTPKVTVGKTYYVKVRAFRYDSCGNRVYGNWSTTEKLKAK